MDKKTRVKHLLNVVLSARVCNTSADILIRKQIKIPLQILFVEFSFQIKAAFLCIAVTLVVFWFLQQDEIPSHRIEYNENNIGRKQVFVIVSI